MLKNEREREIINIMKNQEGFVTVKELCKKLYASESSIRRDLSVLESRGTVRRIYGGAELVTNYSNVISFSKRAHHSTEAKRIIAKKAASLIRDGNVVFLDQSSTSFYLANEIINKSSLTIITNNIETLSLLSDSSVKTIASGGFLSAENRSCLVGADAQYIFENTYADMLFFSAKSLSDEGIISDCAREEVVVRNSMLRNAAKKIFLCDSEKFGTCSPYRQCGLCDVDYLISESDEAKKFSKTAKSLIII